MTYQQLEQKKKEYREKMFKEGYGWVNGQYIQPPQSYKIASEELWCIEMINSILAYGGLGCSAEYVMKQQEQSHFNYLAKYVAVLGRKKVVELIQGQIDSIVCVHTSVFTDDEGVTYNSIVWQDDVT